MGLDWVGLGWVGLDWVGLDWIGLGWDVKIDLLKFNLLPNRVIENFGDALWLGIRPFFCFIM